MTVSLTQRRLHSDLFVLSVSLKLHSLSQWGRDEAAAAAVCVCVCVCGCKVLKLMILRRSAPLNVWVNRPVESPPASGRTWPAASQSPSAAHVPGIPGG